MKAMQKILSLLLAMCMLSAALPLAAAESTSAEAALIQPVMEEASDQPEVNTLPETEEAPAEAAAESVPGEPVPLPEAPAGASDPDSPSESGDAPAAGPMPETPAENTVESMPEPAPETTEAPATEAPGEAVPDERIEPLPDPSPEPAPEASAEPALETAAEENTAELFPSELYIKRGETIQLAIATHPDYAGKELVFHSSWEYCFDVDANGRITGLEAGVDPLFVDADGQRIFTCMIYVQHVDLPSVPIETIQLQQDSFTVSTEDFVELKPRVLPIGAVGELSYSIADSEIAELEDRRLYGMRAGETTLTVTADSGAQLSVPVTIVHNRDPHFQVNEDGWLTGYGGSHRVVIIPEGIKYIGVDAFRNNRDVREVVLPDSCTFIANNAFYYCGLTKIEIPDSVTKISERAFMNSNLASIRLPDRLESIGYQAFAGTDVTKLRIPGTMGVVENNFLPPHLRELEYGEGITEVRYSIGGYTDLRSVTLPASLTVIPDDFLKGLEKEPTFAVYGPAGSVAEAYCAEKGIRFVPKDSIFEDDSFLIENGLLTKYKGSDSHVVIPENATGIGPYVFRDMDFLRSVELHDGVRSIHEGAFMGCTGLGGIELPDGISLISEDAFAGCTGLTSVRLPAGLKKIDARAFMGCSALTGVDLPEGLETIESRAFEGCSAITSLTLPASLRSIFDSFTDCTSLTSLHINDGIERIFGFEGCTSLTNVTIPDSVTMVGGFGGCTSLEDVRLNASLKSIAGNAFKDCTSLKTIDLPDGLTQIGDSAFAGSGIEEITIPDSVNYISYSPFENCASLRQVRLSKNVSSLYNRFFKGCTSLTSVYLPQGMEELRTSAFEGCLSLKSVYVPSSIIYFSKNVFLNCPNLTIITPSGSEAQKYCKENIIPYAKPDALAKYISLPEGDLTLGVDQSYQLKWETDSDYALGTVSFSSSSSKIVAVDKVTGELTAKKTGSATITVKAESGAKANCKVTVKKAPDSVKFVEEEIILGYGESAQLSCILPKNTAAGLIFEGSNFFCLHVEPDGFITAVGPGTDTVTVTTHNGVLATCTVTVLDAPTQVLLEQTQIRVPQSLSYQFNPSVNEGSLCRSYSYASNAPEIASVDENGLLTAHAMGTAEITVSVSAAPEIYAICRVTVTDPPPRIVLAAENLTLGLKESFDLNPRYDGDFKGSFICESSNPKYVTVDENGVITAKKVGSAVISVTGESGLTTSCSVTVKKAPSSIKLNPASLEMGAGEAMRLGYTLSKGSAGSVSFESSAPEIAAVSPDGMITAVSPGSATITARTFNGRKTSAKITVLAAPESIAIERWGDPLRLGLGESGTLSVIFSPGSGGSYSFESSDSDVVEIDSSGKFRAKMLGDCTLTLTAYNGISETREIQVCMPPKKLEFDSYYSSKVTIGVGQKQPLYLFYHAADNQPCGPGLSFKSSNTKVATVDANGVVTGIKPGSATITVTSFNGLKDTSRITVKKAPTALSVNATELYLGYWETFAIEAKLSPSSVSSWYKPQFTCSAPSKLFLEDDGMIRANAREGTATVTVSTYNGLSQTITVHMGPPPSYIRFPQEEITLCVGMKFPLEYECDGYFSTGSIETSDKKVAYVDDDGLIVAKKKGTAEITIETYNGQRAVLKVKVESAPKEQSFTLPLPLRTGKAYNLCNYFSSSPSYDPMLMIESVKLNNDRAELYSDASGWYLIPKEPGSITLTVRTVSSSIRVKATILEGADPSMPDIHSPENTSAVAADYLGTWKLVCLGSREYDLTFSPEEMGVNPYIIHIREADGDIISDDASMLGMPYHMEGSAMVFFTGKYYITSQLHENGYLTLPQEDEGVHLWFERQ